MVHSLVLLDNFIMILGSALILTLIFVLSGLYYLVKFYYFMQMSASMDRATKIILKFFFYGIFGPIIILFAANDVAIPLFARPSAEQLEAYHAGTLQVSLIEHNLNTGALYLLILAIVGLAWGAYYLYKKKMKEKKGKESGEDEPSQGYRIPPSQGYRH